ncbi:hypothetical protein J3Q64DRAFT_1776782 [Phycomyces blakesleeanus]
MSTPTRWTRHLPQTIQHTPQPAQPAQQTQPSQPTQPAQQASQLTPQATVQEQYARTDKYFKMEVPREYGLLQPKSQPQLQPQLQLQPQPQHQPQHQPQQQPYFQQPYHPSGYARPIQPIAPGTGQNYRGSNESVESKRIRISRACDACRRKKIKCTTDNNSGPCRNCTQSCVECTYNDRAKRRGPPKG